MGCPALHLTPPVCICLCKERCFVAQSELCSGRQAVLGSTAHLEIRSGLYFCQNTAYFCGILHLAQMMGQASCCGDMRNSLIAVCLPLPPPPASLVHPKRVAGEEAVVQSPLRSSSQAFVLPRTVPSMAPRALSPNARGNESCPGLSLSLPQMVAVSSWERGAPGRCQWEEGTGAPAELHWVSPHSAGLPSSPLEAITCSSFASSSPIIVHQQCQAPIVPSRFPKT